MLSVPVPHVHLATTSTTFSTINQPIKILIWLLPTLLLNALLVWLAALIALQAPPAHFAHQVTSGVHQPQPRLDHAINANLFASRARTLPTVLNVIVTITSQTQQSQTYQSN